MARAARRWIPWSSAVASASEIDSGARARGISAGRISVIRQTCGEVDEPMHAPAREALERQKRR